MCVDILSWNPDMYKELVDGIQLQLNEPAERSTAFSPIFAAPYGKPSVRNPDKKPDYFVEVHRYDPELGDNRPWVWFYKHPYDQMDFSKYYETDPEDMMKMAKDINDWIGAE